MKQTIILLAGVFALCLSGLVAESAAIEKSTFNNALLIQEDDPDLNMETWMVNSKYWTTSDNESISITEESDEKLELEAWMIKDSYWN